MALGKLIFVKEHCPWKFELTATSLKASCLELQKKKIIYTYIYKRITGCIETSTEALRKERFILIDMVKNRNFVTTCVKVSCVEFQYLLNRLWDYMTKSFCDLK